ncbi:MAG: tetratricopeptide repeat protein [Phycisphaerales bacterium]|nr:MAG: tetratricopeptide repeat protein [Phycisphaerales bacterium]
MTYVADDKTLWRARVVSGVALCLFLAGCGRWFSEPVDDEPVRKADRYDRAISEFDVVLENNPHNARAYYERGLVYYNKGEYDKAWEDVRKAQSLGYQVPAEFIRLLSDASQGKQ